MICLVFENKKLTKFMRALDLFEKTKFIGFAVTCTQKKDKFLKFPFEDKDHFLVAQILGNEIKIHPDYKDHLISDGKCFMKLKEYCILEGAEMAKGEYKWTVS